MPGGFHPPPKVVASWPTPNYVNPTERGPGVVIIASIFSALSLTIAGLRLWVRFKVQREPGLDDYIISVALLPAIGMVITLGLISPLHGWYRHIWDVPPQNFVPIQRLNWITQLFFLISNILTKISILVLYLRVIRGAANKIFLSVVRVAIAILVAYGVSGVVLLCLMCQPLDAYWKQFDFIHPPSDFTCWNEGILPMYSVSFNLFTDFMVTCLPMSLFIQLKMPLREKVSLAAVFGVGFIVCISGIIRFYYYYYVFFRTYDITWVAYKVWVWTAVECHLGIICASIPPLRILFKRFLKGTMYGSSYAQNSRSKTTTNPNDSVDKDSKAYPLQNGPRHTKSTEWDKDSNSSSRPLEWPSQKGILRTDNFEVNYNSRHSAKLPPV